MRGDLYACPFPSPRITLLSNQLETGEREGVREVRGQGGMSGGRDVMGGREGGRMEFKGKRDIPSHCKHLRQMALDSYWSLGCIPVLKKIDKNIS